MACSCDVSHTNCVPGIDTATILPYTPSRPSSIAIARTAVRASTLATSIHHASRHGFLARLHQCVAGQQRGDPRKTGKPDRGCWCRYHQCPNHTCFGLPTHLLPTGQIVHFGSVRCLACLDMLKTACMLYMQCHMEQCGQHARTHPLSMQYATAPLILVVSAHASTKQLGRS